MKHFWTRFRDIAVALLTARADHYRRLME